MSAMLAFKQWQFVQCVAAFIQRAGAIPGLWLTFGDTYDADGDGGHAHFSLHGKRLAIDLNLFVRGQYISSYEMAPQIWDSLGTTWKSLHPLARWGGNWKSKDLNHFSFEHEGRQ